MTAHYPENSLSIAPNTLPLNTKTQISDGTFVPLPRFLVSLSGICGAGGHVRPASWDREA